MESAQATHSVNTHSNRRAPHHVSEKSRGEDFYEAVNFVRLRAVDLVPTASAGNFKIVPPASAK
jgi:hypothetical protein